MPRVPFEQLPSHARLWIFAAARPLTPEERRRVLAEVDGFIDQWAAHGLPLTAARDMRHEQFLLVAVDEQVNDASGCSVDKLVRQMQQLGKALGVELVDNGPVLYREGPSIKRVPRDEFADLAATGRVSLDTLVFDNTLTSVRDLEAGRWEVRAAHAWHARAFFTGSA